MSTVIGGGGVRGPLWESCRGVDGMRKRRSARRARHARNQEGAEDSTS